MSSPYQDTMGQKEFVMSPINDRPPSPSATLTPGSPRSGFNLPYADRAGEYKAVPTTDAEAQRRPSRKRRTLSQLAKAAVEGDGGKRTFYSVSGVVVLFIWVIIVSTAARYRWRSKKYPVFTGKPPEPGTQEIAIHIWIRQYDPVMHEIAALWRPMYIDHTLQVNTSQDLPDISIFRNAGARSRNRTRAAAVETWDGDSSWLGLADAKEVKLPVDALTQTVWQQLDYGYPFDQAQSISQWAATSGGVEIPIAGAFLVDVGLNIEVIARTGDIRKEGCGVANSTEPCYFQLRLITQRPRYVQLSVVAVVILNWAITISLFVLASESRGIRRFKILEGTDELSVFFAALFALPGIRNLLPGIPSAGCLIDLIGIIPNAVSIGLCVYPPSLQHDRTQLIGSRLLQAIWMTVSRICGKSMRMQNNEKEA